MKQNWNGTKLLVFPCGTGKTVTFSKFLKQSTFKNIFIVSPLTYLVEQTHDIVKTYLPNYNHILVDTNGTTDFNDVKNNLNKYVLFSTTFKSAKNIISKIFDKENNCELSHNSIIIIDEAHNILNLDKLINIIKKFPKVLLVTATPSIQMEEVIPSEVIYYYPFKQAIDEGYICDYKIYLPFIQNNKIMITIPSELYHLDQNLCKKCLFFANGLLKTGSRRPIVYLKSIEECNLYKKILEEIMSKYHYYNVFSYIHKCISENNRKLTINLQFTI